MNKKFRIEFSDWDYIKAHGKKPRGKGTWYFYCREFDRFEYGTLTEAKRKVCKYIRENAPADHTFPMTIIIGS